MPLTEQDKQASAELKKALWKIVAKHPASDLKTRIERELKRDDRDCGSFRAKRSRKHAVITDWANDNLAESFDDSATRCDVLYEKFIKSEGEQWKGYTTFCRTLAEIGFNIVKHNALGNVVTNGGYNVVIGVEVA